ncbi:hypothetical protein XA68_18451 [Ophiocordyceps unilateralis]|uniref:Uncharacterized protein n=1 Tax=Ophiocordyceps unilateralis TaxID=268505 RepID=A0A2A9PI09_OPHUN|nr:hypothetical protein XA68_18451 [Ophiocordyceps unilateralis]
MASRTHALNILGKRDLIRHATQTLYKPHRQPVLGPDVTRLWRPKVRVLQVSQVQNQLLQNHVGLSEPHLNRVLAPPREAQVVPLAPDAVHDGPLPIPRQAPVVPGVVLRQPMPRRLAVIPPQVVLHPASRIRLERHVELKLQSGLLTLREDVDVVTEERQLVGSPKVRVVGQRHRPGQRPS